MFPFILMALGFFIFAAGLRSISKNMAIYFRVMVPIVGLFIIFISFTFYCYDYNEVKLFKLKADVAELQTKCEIKPK